MMHRFFTALLAALLVSSPAAAFESDVHFGLTRWLALQAGFTAQQADAIATGNSRVDSGDIQFIDLSFVYACLVADDEAAQLVSKRHYPIVGAIPAPPEKRAVAPGSEAAIQADLELMKMPPTHAGFMLVKLGEALHTLQDSWSHQGVPDVPQVDGALFKCDATRAWAHSKQRGGWNSHKADLTAQWPVDAMAMAKATYDALVRYPRISQDRQAEDWNRVRTQLDGFIKAATKGEKRAWFAAHGFEDVSFLEGTSLRDGSQPFVLKWGGRRLPPLPDAKSRQHFIDQDVLDFMSRFFSDWMTTDNLPELAAAVTAPPPPGPRARGAFVPLDKNEIAAQLKLWLMRDHGAAADLAHAPLRLTGKQIASVEAAAKVPGALVRYKAATDGLVPLVTKGKDASPLLPFIIGDTPPADGGNRRVAAITRLRHLPYDTVAVIAEMIEGQWRVIGFASTVDH